MAQAEVAQQQVGHGVAGGKHRGQCVDMEEARVLDLVGRADDLAGLVLGLVTQHQRMRKRPRLAGEVAQLADAQAQLAQAQDATAQAVPAAPVAAPAPDFSAQERQISAALIAAQQTAETIVNDANDWAVETMGNPRYPMELFQRVVTVSLETMKIVRALPKLDIASTAN